MAQALKSDSKDLERFPETKRIFLKNGAGFEAGDKLVQPELARTLERIQTKGPTDFYTGETAKIFAAEMAKTWRADHPCRI